MRQKFIEDNDENDFKGAHIVNVYGVKGDQGTEGPMGPKGAMGPQGVQGDMGSQGPTGPEGFEILTADPDNAAIGEKWLLYTKLEDGTETLQLKCKLESGLFKLDLTKI